MVSGQRYNDRTDKNEKIVELVSSHRLSDNKKRRIVTAAFSGVCAAAICISVGAAAGRTADTETNAADLSDYSYSASETGADAENNAASGSVSARIQSRGIPSVSVPECAPAERSDRESASVSVSRSFEPSPEVFDVTIKSKNGTDFISASGTVKDALLKAGVDTDKNDIVTPSLGTALTDGLIITVKDVKISKVTVRETIRFDTEYVDDGNLPLGETRVLSYGENGFSRKVYRIKKVDGEETSKKLLSEEIISSPVNEVVAVGTYSAPMDEYEDNGGSEPDNYELYGAPEDDEFYSDYEEEFVSEPVIRYSGEGIEAASVPAISQFEVPADLILDEDNAPIKYVRTVHGRACAYTAEPGSLMSTGKEVDQGYVAVNPEIIPYGSKLYIVADDGEVYGYAIAGDTGGSVMRGSIVVDLFMWDYDECMDWGNKDVTVYIIEEGDNSRE